MELIRKRNEKESRKMKLHQRFISWRIRALESWARFFKLKRKITIGEHKIDIDWILPNKKVLGWDDNHYIHTNIFVKGRANPIEIKLSKNKLLLIPSRDYARAMQTKLVDELTAEISGGDRINKAVALLLLVGFANLGVMSLLLLIILGVL